MASIGVSPVEQFRSNVQWFLEGNTPSYQTELIVDLLVCLKTLANHIRSATINDQEHQESVRGIATEFDNFTRKQLGEVASLEKVIASLSKLVSLGDRQLTDNKAFRETMVRLIVVAEMHPEIPFKRSVLELANKL